MKRDINKFRKELALADVIVFRIQRRKILGNPPDRIPGLYRICSEGLVTPVIIDPVRLGIICSLNEKQIVAWAEKDGYKAEILDSGERIRISKKGR